MAGTDLVLASGSAARRALLEAACVPVRVVRPEVDEAAVKRALRHAGPDAAALRLAEIKALAVSLPGATVIGADQILVCGDRWFDKPADMAQARAHLQALRGRPHELVTAAVLVRDGVVLWRHVARPRLAVRAFSDAFLDTYLRAEGEILLSTVGAYRLEARGIHLFDRVDGEHAAILGLPLLPLLAELRQQGMLPS